ncbi:hypothetical protein JOB18_026008, partial [Solea senegalensis]
MQAAKVESRQEQAEGESTRKTEDGGGAQLLFCTQSSPHFTLFTKRLVKLLRRVLFSTPAVFILLQRLTEMLGGNI